MASQAELDALRRAVLLSGRALGRTSPNPPVRAVVLVPSGQVVGEGWTRPPGGPHAEVVALAEAGERARGGTAVVTLEPCRHTGRTGPCTQALLDAGVARVVVACADPTEQAGTARAAIGDRDIWLRVDGGVSAETIERCAQAGADVFVAGSAVYGTDDPAAAVEALRAQADAARAAVVPAG